MKTMLQYDVREPLKVTHLILKILGSNSLHSVKNEA